MNTNDKKELEDRRLQQKLDGLSDSIYEWGESEFGPARDDLSERTERKQRRWTAVQRTGILAALGAAAIAISGNISRFLHLVVKLIKAWLNG